METTRHSAHFCPRPDSVHRSVKSLPCVFSFHSFPHKHTMPSFISLSLSFSILIVLCSSQTHVCPPRKELFDLHLILLTTDTLSRIIIRRSWIRGKRIFTSVSSPTMASMVNQATIKELLIQMHAVSVYVCRPQL